MRTVDISALDHDILWLIFMTIASSDSDHTNIHHIKNAGSVCSAWRRIIMDSSVLWGRLVWIGNSRTSSESWISSIPMVLLRSKLSPLWVRGVISLNDDWWDSNSSEGTVFLSLMDKNWNRIERVDLTIMGRSVLSYGEEKWKVFLRPAPILRYFHCIVNRDDAFYGNAQKPPLRFTNHAPLLRAFSSDFFLDWTLKQNTLKSWFHDLRHFQTSRGVVTSFSTFITLIKGMKHLETLRIAHRIDGVDGIDAGTGWPVEKHTIDMPCLTILEINGPMDHCMWFMHSIDPTTVTTFSFICNAGISKNIRTLHAYDTLIEEFHVEFSKKIEYYAMVHRRILPFEHLYLIISQQTFYLGNRGQYDTDAMPTFNITVNSDITHNGPYRIRRLFEVFSSVYLEDTSTVHLTINKKASTVKEYFSSYMPLFHTLSSVETLHVSSWKNFFNFYSFSRRNFQEYDPRYPVIFPELKTLNLTQVNDEKQFGQYTVADTTLRLFLVNRVEVGFPVENLWLSRKNDTQRYLETDLASIPNLKTHWHTIGKVSSFN